MKSDWFFSECLTCKALPHLGQADSGGKMDVALSSSVSV